MTRLRGRDSRGEESRLVRAAALLDQRRRRGCRAAHDRVRRAAAPARCRPRRSGSHWASTGEVDMNYDAFIGQVNHRGRFSSKGKAVAAVRATLTTLAERLTRDEAFDLAAQL